MELALGTAQFGMKYGVANKNSDFSLNKIDEILEYASKNQIDTLDTAMNYGEAEKRLGEIGVNDWNVITKLNSPDENLIDPVGWINEKIESSLQNLRIASLSGVLIHDAKLLNNQNGKLIWQRLNQLKSQGLIKKVGISIYQPSELDSLFNNFKFDIVQAPFNVFDKRIEKSGWLSKIPKENKELHTRSIFLQGLLLMSSESRPKKFNYWKKFWENWDNWLIKNNLNALEACLGVVFQRSEISKIVIGIDSLKQLKEIITAKNKINLVDPPSCLSCEDEMLINPSNWNSL
jgi:aryl-alcohol dehydrogenase-like predicted oxidoreductase